MIRLAKLTDYGIVVLSYIARDGGSGVHNARDIAAEVNLPLPTVSKLLKMLTRSGLLAARRGVKGGYQLSRLPQQISMIEIINALEGPISMTECASEPLSACMIEVGCPVRSNWQRINDAVYNALQGISLADMAQSVCRCGVKQVSSLSAACHDEPKVDVVKEFAASKRDRSDSLSDSHFLRAQGADDEGRL